MNSKFIFWILIYILFLNSCYKSTEWEEVSVDYDPVLNIIGIISLDDSTDSFVGVYRTTELTEVSMIFTGVVDTISYYDYEEDTVFTWLDSLYEPAGVIDSAVVKIFTDIETYIFEFDAHARKYKYSGFTPSEDTHYSLKIEVNGFDPVTGELITPITPYLDTFLIEDTLSASSTYPINWDNNQTTAKNGLLTGELIDSYVHCGGEFYSIIEFDSEQFTVFQEWCDPEEIGIGDIDNDSGIQTQNECLCGNYFKIWESGECYCSDNPLELEDLFVDVTNDNPLIAPFGNCQNAINDLGCDYIFPNDQIYLISLCPQFCEINNCSDLLNNEACYLEPFYAACPLTCVACVGDATQPTGLTWDPVNDSSNYGYCGDGSPDYETLRIRLVAMDDNYYQYFARERFKDFSNFLFETEGTSGQSVGISGGFGVFGAFASDTLTRVLSP